MKIYARGIAAVFVLLMAPQAHAIDFNPFSIIKKAVEAVAEDRSSTDIATDIKIQTKITAKIVRGMKTGVLSISTDVYEQDVLLTGAVEEAKYKTQAEKLAREVEGIKKLFNEIRVVKAVEKDKGTVENFVDDTVIESKINALLLDGSGVNVTNFRWRSVGGHVFLFGRALSQAEHAKATKIAQGIKNVVSVKNLAKIRPKS
ncbi:MAG: BON domain-containing protein [Proteobacteria bacterium]|nr:BON domain-containing protein [Pseudomonadota bacterium]